MIIDSGFTILQLAGFCSSDENIAGGTWPSEIDNLMTDYFGLKLTTNKYYKDEDLSNLCKISLALGSKKGVIFFINNQNSDENKASAKNRSGLNARLGIHFIVIKSLEAKHDKNGKIISLSYTYWDYGGSEDAPKKSGEMTYEVFQESTKGIFISNK